MRKIIYVMLLLTIGFSHDSVANKNLEFNQVLLYSGHLFQYASPVVYTVPEGKVWKIESRTKAVYPSYFVINSIPVDGNFGGSSSGPLGEADGNIIWLKAGDQINYTTNLTNGLRYYLSILEFNVVSQ